ncbi:MAG: TRAP transporter small permease [Syntrophales bacterium]|jgi:TRAP-type C4-dicarboxylate transport system permease small subunit|nr:TRAP transporter small permease [Syntrophales bacterium]MDX9922006.1 TRAP transporter small permease [Syntrophales bacterium]
MKNKERAFVIERVAAAYKTFAITLSWISVITIFIMIFSTTIDATARFLFNNPIPGMFELNEVILVICVFMGATWTQIERGHIRVEVFLMKSSARKQYILNTISWFVALIFAAILCYQTYMGFLDSYSVREFRWGSIQMPIWWAKGLVPLGLLLLMIQLIFDIIMEVRALLGWKDDGDGGDSATTVREF